VTGGDQEKLDKAPDAGAEPTFNEYYEPSSAQKADVYGDWLG